jgi:uncharacterized membrane protein
VALACVTLLLTLTNWGHQFVQGVLSDPRVRQVVGLGGPGAALRAVFLARFREPWLLLTLSLLLAEAGYLILHPPKARRNRRGSTGSTQFASLLFLCGLGLTLIVEFVYLRDSFGVRMNTIFKFYYQAWVMLGCASAYGVWWVLHKAKSDVVRGGFLGGVLVLTAAGMVYSVLATYSRVDGFRGQPDLNGAANIAQGHPDDWTAIEWLSANADGVPVILEAPGKSYDYEGRISAFTGCPAVLGWALHESQWRGDYVEQGKREPAIQAIYTSADRQQVLAMLEEWNVNYVVLGAPEYQYIEEICGGTGRLCSGTETRKRFERLLEPAFEQGQTTIYRVPQGE